MSTQRIDRRGAIGMMAGITAGVAAGLAAPAGANQPNATGRLNLKGRLKHSVCRWCYGKMPLDELCRNAAEIGLQSVELLGPEEWGTAKAHGLTCAVASNVKSNPIPKGFNRVENHDAIVRDLEERLPLVAAAGLPCQIVFSGNRGGMPDTEGAANCVKGLKRIAPLAEKLGITLVMELLNSKDHGDYQCDFTRWGVEVVKGVGSDRFRLLYDIYHMQRMEGEIIETVQKNLEHIAHFHTGGVPGRAEIDETQELNYAAICKAIADAGYRGYLAQEFIPRRDPMTSLRRAVEICDQ